MEDQNYLSKPYRFNSDWLLNNNSERNADLTSMIRAMIDIGTNTAHMLIAEIASDHSRIIRILFKKRVYTYLGEYGLETIHDTPLQKLYDGLDIFAAAIRSHQATDTVVLATEALRTAANGHEIREHIKDIYGWCPQIIDGLLEAHLIARGAMQAVDMSTGQYIVMDIGGGSVEFIHVIDGIIKKKISTPLGISRLYQSYHQQDPIDANAITQLDAEVDRQLATFREELADREATLVGTAGSFELFLSADELTDPNLLSKKVDTAHILQETQRIIPTTIGQRELDPTIPANRAKYILVALLLMSAVIKTLDINSVMVSKYALKEGAILN